MTSTKFFMFVAAICWPCIIVTQESPSILKSSPPDSLKLDTSKFVNKIRALVGKEYPQAKVTVDGNHLHFEFKTRKFMIHEPFKTGEWQDAHETTGPQHGGILCEMEFAPGKYGAQAAVPQKIDKHYYTLWLAAPYSDELDCHLYIHLYYPRNIKPEFAKEFTSLVNRFPEYCDKPE